MWIFEAAYRHGLDNNDILHAWEHALGFYDIDLEYEPTKSLCIGPDSAGNLLEILYLQFADDDVIIHAMPLRPLFRTYLTAERP